MIYIRTLHPRNRTKRDLLALHRIFFLKIPYQKRKILARRPSL